ncbi:MAG: hypothetical protein Q6361_00700 [Candidatus Hermodarchaeota archaeon]|nr:hypothetical protein [Candidatus Hermodarchaeota archaeon]
MSPKTSVLQIGELWKEPVEYKVSVVKDGYCRANHKKGETFEFNWNTPEGLCGESYVGMYPLLHSLRVRGDMREIGGPDRSPARNIRVYICPGRVIHFRIEAKYRCNLCGAHLPIENGTIGGYKLEEPDQNIKLNVCTDCYQKHREKKLAW